MAAAACLSASAAVPNAPTNLLATAVSSTQISLNWNDASSDEFGFQVERSTDGASFSQIAQVLPNTVNCRDSLVWPGTTYTYRVRAYNSSGSSAYSAPAGVASPSLCPNTLASWGFAPAPPIPNLTGIVAVAAGYGDTLTRLPAPWWDGAATITARQHHRQA